MPRDSLRPKTITKIFDETGKGTRRPTEVQIAVEVSHCWDLNIRTESFCIEFSVYCKWKANAEEGVAIGHWVDVRVRGRAARGARVDRDHAGLGERAS